MKGLVSVISALLLVPGLAAATTPVPYTPTGLIPLMVGVENGGTDAYVGISVAQNTNGCWAGGIYFFTTVTTANGTVVTNANFPSQVEGVAMAAKMAGKTLRIDYLQPGGANTQCVGYGIYVQ